MSDVMVSVFLVVFNEEKYILQALDSLVNQITNFEYEIICHDDASTDSTVSIIQKYCDKYKNIVPVFQKENKCKTGCNITIDYMYPLAKGKYIAYCDGDDYWTDMHRLQKLYDYMENNDDCVMCLHNYDYLFEDKSNKIVKSKCPKKERDFAIGEMIMWGKNIPQIGTSFFRKTIAQQRPLIFQKIGGGKNSKRAISDHPLYIYMALIGRVHYFPSCMSVWRRCSGTWGADNDIKRTLTFYDDVLDFLNLFNEFSNYNYDKIIQKKKKAIYFDKAFKSCDYKKAFCLSWGVKSSFKAKIISFVGLFSKKIANALRGIK